MKIIHLILGKARPERMNGVSKVAHNLAMQHSLQGHDVALWGITPTPNESGGERSYATRFFQSHRNKLVLDASLKSAIAELAGKDACVHIHGGFIPEFFLAARVCRKYGVRYVYSPHGAFSPVALQFGSVKKRLYFRIFESRIVRHAYKLHFLGKIQYDAFDKVLKIDHKVLIPNGQDMDELEFPFQPMERPDAPVFSYCGRLLIHYKGLDMLLDAFARYRQRGGEGVLWLIGDGPHREQLAGQAKALGITDAVRFWGSQYGHAKNNILANTDAFVHPSRSEGFPTGVLEAAGLGLPCVVSTATNAGTFIEEHEAGIHLKENSAEGIFLALQEIDTLHQSGQLKARGLRAKEMVRNSFNWPGISQRIAEIYH